MIKNLIIKNRLVTLIMGGMMLFTCGCSQGNVEKESDEPLINYEILDENGYYIVKKDDTAWEIAEKFGMTVEELARLNGITVKELDMIYEGQKFKICNLVKENTIGSFDMKHGIFDYKIGDANFFLFSVNSSKSRSNINNLNEKIKKCNEENIPVGIVFHCKATESDIYSAIEDAKLLISNFDINYPMYLDVTQIIRDPNLKLGHKLELLKIYLNACNENMIYGALYGTDTDLCLLDDNMTIPDACVIQDSDEIKYCNNYSMCINQNGEVVSKIDVSKKILNQGYNRKENLGMIKTIEIEDNPSIEDIANKYDISVNDLLKFNGKSEFKDGDIVRIPTKNVFGVYIGGKYYALTDEPIRGFDISEFQTFTDWEKLCENFDYCIIKCAEGKNYVDPKFEENVAKCEQNGIPYGFYCVNSVDIINEKNKKPIDLELFRKEQEQQADFVLKIANEKSASYPIYIDLEPGLINILDSLPNGGFEYKKIIVDVWKNKMESNGFIPGIYFNISGYNSFINYGIDLSGFNIWIAGGYEYSDVRSIEDVTKPEDIIIKNYGDRVMHQVGDHIKNCGAGTDAGYLDVDFSYIDFTNVVELKLEEELKYDKTIIGSLIEKYGKSSLILITSAGTIIGCIIVNKHNQLNNKKNNKRRKNYKRKQ